MLTVKQLKEKLAAYPDDLQVVAGYNDVSTSKITHDFYFKPSYYRPPGYNPDKGNEKFLLLLDFDTSAIYRG